MPIGQQLQATNSCTSLARWHVRWLSDGTQRSHETCKGRHSSSFAVTVLYIEFTHVWKILGEKNATLSKEESAADLVAM